MRKIWIALAFATIMAKPASAQDFHKNFVECTKELGLQADPNYTHRLLSTGHEVRRWYFHSEPQQAAFSDCVARKANLAGKRSLP
jgi:hypothetical protein